MDELSQLDELIESDILEALGQETPEHKAKNIDDIEVDSLDEIKIEDFQEVDNELPLNEQEITIENLDEEIDLPAEEEVIALNENLENISNTENSQKINTDINTTDIASLLSQLLANKTIEITIKIKD